VKAPRDIRAPDGIIANGERYVRKGGRVKFAGLWWQSDLLLPFVGLPVDCGGMDYWQTQCDFSWIIWPNDGRPLPDRKNGSKLICTVRK
jgi:hypothetical protein